MSINNSQDDLNRFLEAYAKHLKILPACREAGIKHQAVYKRVRENKRFAEQLKEIELIQKESVIQSLYELASEHKDLPAIKYYLEKMFPAEFGNIVKVEQTITHRMNSMTEEELEEILNR